MFYLQQDFWPHFRFFTPTRAYYDTKMPFANIYKKARTVNFNDLTRQHITSSVPKTQKATKTSESKIIFTQNFEMA